NLIFSSQKTRCAWCTFFFHRIYTVWATTRLPEERGNEDENESSTERSSRTRGFCTSDGRGRVGKKRRTRYQQRRRGAVASQYWRCNVCDGHVSRGHCRRKEIAGGRHYLAGASRRRDRSIRQLRQRVTRSMVQPHRHMRNSDFDEIGALLCNFAVPTSFV